jgi:hypothetical protein
MVPTSISEVIHLDPLLVGEPNPLAKGHFGFAMELMDPLQPLRDRINVRRRICYKHL